MIFELWAGEGSASLFLEGHASDSVRQIAVEDGEEPVALFDVATSAEAAQLRNDLMGWGPYEPMLPDGFGENWAVRRFVALEALVEMLEPGPMRDNATETSVRLWDEMQQEDRDEVVRLSLREHAMSMAD